MLLTLLGAAAALAAPTLDRASQSAHRTPPRDSLGAHADLYSGRAGNLRVRTPRINTHIDLDGTLDNPVWQQAAVLTGFSEYQPVDGLAAEDSTDVLVWYSSTAIYFGIRAYEVHGAVHATQANRDKINGDDNVQVIIRPFISAHQALVFAGQPTRRAAGWHDHRGRHDGARVRCCPTRSARTPPTSVPTSCTSPKANSHPTDTRWRSGFPFGASSFPRAQHRIGESTSSAGFSTRVMLIPGTL